MAWQYYKVSGAGTPFIFQHGLSANLDQPQNLLSPQTDVQLISMDCPGHGNTPLRLGQEPSFNFYTNEVLRLMQQLDIRQTIMGGISMGAGISLNMAIRFPHKVKALVLVRPAWLAEKNPKNLQLLNEAVKYIGKPNGSQQFEQHPAYQLIKKELPAAAKSIMGIFGNQQQAVIPTVIKNMVADSPFDQLDALQKIQCPCLIIANDNDPLHPYDMARSLHHELSGSTLVKITSRYLDPTLHQKELNGAIQRFIAQFSSEP